MKPLNFREQDFKREVEKQPYSKQIRDEFFDYWSEPDRGQSPKMRFEKEKTWDLGRRLARWAKNNNQGKMQPEMRKETPQTEIQKLDYFLAQYRKPGGADIPFEKFGEHYDYMKVNKFLLQIDQSRVEELLATYKGDKFKCRCWCVRATLEMYINSGLTFTDIIKMRERLNA